VKFLVTGGAGFIGSNFIELTLRNRPRYEIVCLDALTYAGNLANLKNVESDPNLAKRYRFVKGSIEDREAVEKEMVDHGVPDAIVNFAAESHVDRSLEGAVRFVRTNVEGTLVLLECAKKGGVKRFLQISTDEVYGSLGEEGAFYESTPLHPNNPYAVTKASADLMTLAFRHTHKLETIITRSSNNYGPRQYPEKLIPLLIANALEGKEIPVYGDGMQVRDWLHVYDNARGILAALENGRPGEIYNLGGGNERPNIEVVTRILKILGKPESLIRHVQDRPGHDRRYSIDFSKALNELDWSPRTPFDQGLQETADWYQANKEWVAGVKSGEYMKYYEERYGKLLS
jgi:dTDP-glucose 4,6-dehydratase